MRETVDYWLRILFWENNSSGFLYSCRCVCIYSIFVCMFGVNFYLDFYCIKFRKNHWTWVIPQEDYNNYLCSVNVKMPQNEKENETKTKIKKRIVRRDFWASWLTNDLSLCLNWNMLTHRKKCLNQLSMASVCVFFLFEK